MAKTEPEAIINETVTQSDAPPENAIKDRKSILTAKRLETVVAILLGVTTLLSAWASWIGHLHGGLQSIHFTESNNTASQGVSDVNYAMQLYLSDYLAWNTAKEYYYELEEAKLDGNQSKIDLIEDKIAKFSDQEASAILDEGIKWMEENNEDNPFKMPGITDKYLETANATASESQRLLDEGKHDNTKGDSYMLVTVIYSLVLFLLGIINTFKTMPNKLTVLAIAVTFLILAFIYMCTIPMPTGFTKMNFFEFNN